MHRNYTASRIPVKPSRVTPRPSTRFGAGLTFYVPHVGRVPFTAADAAEAVAMFADAQEPDWDAMAGEAAAVDRMGRGLRLG